MKSLKTLLFAIIAIVAINISTNNDVLAGDGGNECPVAAFACCGSSLIGGQWMSSGCQTSPDATDECFSVSC